MASQGIPGYDGVRIGTIRDYGAYVKKAHIELARTWLSKKLTNSASDSTNWHRDLPLTVTGAKAKYDQAPATKDWTNWEVKSEKEIKEKLHELNSSFNEWENHLGMKSWKYHIRDLDEGAEANFDCVKIPSRCVSLAVVRVGIMHEIYELRLLSKYGFTSTFMQAATLQDATVARVNALAPFESFQEKQIRELNVTLCKNDLRTVCDALLKSGKKDGLYENCRKLNDNIGSYIPGYCEIYSTLAYRNTDYSSIAKYFKQAETRGISLIKTQLPVESL